MAAREAAKAAERERIKQEESIAAEKFEKDRQALELQYKKELEEQKLKAVSAVHIERPLLYSCRFKRSKRKKQI